MGDNWEEGKIPPEKRRECVVGGDAQVDSRCKGNLDFLILADHVWIGGTDRKVID